MTKSSSGAEGSAAKQVHLQTASGSRTSSLCIASIEGEAVEGARRDLRARQTSSTSRSVKLARARPGGATKHLPPPARSSSAAQERRPAVRAEPRRTSERSKADERDPPLVQANLDEIAAADLDEIAAFPPLQQDSKSPIADVSSPTEQARTSEGGDRNTSSAGHGRGAPQDEDLSARTTSTSNTKHQPEAGHSRHHPAEAIYLPAKHPSSIDDKNRERGASSRRNMESSDSREHVAEDGKQPQRVPVLGL